MENKEWLKSLYSDGSSYFVSNPLPKTGEEICVAMQVSEKAPVTAVFLQAKFNGVQIPMEMKKVSTRGGLCRYEVKTRIYEKEMKYFFTIATPDCIYYYTQNEVTTWIPNESYLFRILTNYSQPEWVKNAVFYQIFPERFCNGNPDNDVQDGEYTFDGFPSQKIKEWEKKPESYSKAHCLDFYGGDLEGIRQKIPYLKKLGVTCLYINPIFYAATVHKYDCLDYFHVDPHFGGDKALEELTSELHKNGIRIILDVSINHTGIANRWFNRDGTFFPKSEGAYNNPDSPERSFYFFNKDNTYKAWFDVETLPTLNYTSQALRKRIFLDQDSLVKKWLKAPYSTDGWRFDVADTMGRNNEIQLHHEIWPLIRKSIKEENKDAYILAEDWTDCAEFLNGDEWDSPMNYYGSCRPIRQFFGQNDIFNGRSPILAKIPYKMTAKDFVSQITSWLNRLPFAIQQMQFNLVNSHDVARFHNDKKMDEEKVRGAAIILFTLPGAANMYYGDEANIDGYVEEVEGCRYPMPWSRDIESTDSYSLYHKLIQVKTSAPSFKDGGFKVLYAEGYVFAYARFTPEEIYITVVSQSEKDEEIEIPLDAFSTEAYGKAPEKDILDQSLKASINEKKLTLKVPAGKSYLIKL